MKFVFEFICTFSRLWLKSPEVRVRWLSHLVVSMCAGVPGCANFFFILNCVKTWDFIFEMLTFTNFRFCLINNHNISAFLIVIIFFLESFKGLNGI